MGPFLLRLQGMLLRIGPNPVNVPDPKEYHWFTGDGMVHAIELRDGLAVSYRNRWVQTRELGRRDQAHRRPVGLKSRSTDPPTPTWSGTPDECSPSTRPASPIA